MPHLGEKDFVNHHDYIQAQKDLIHKGLYGGLPCEDLVEKAEGDNFDGMFDKAESPEHKAKMEKVMAEFKAGTLKTSAGEKVTDRDQAIAIALSEAKVEKAMTAAAGEGVTQKESVEHNPKDMQNPKASDLKKAYEILGLGDVIEKGGKGSGHKKGSMIKVNKNHPQYDALKGKVGVVTRTHHLGVDAKFGKEEYEIHHGEYEKSEEVDIEKAEGSRGGKVIGHTKSGKPIYEHNHGDVLHIKGGDDDGLPSGKYRVKNTKTEDDEPTYHLEDKEGKEHKMTRDWIEKKGYHKNSSHTVSRENTK